MAQSAHSDGEIAWRKGDVDADQYMRVLAMGMNGARPVKATLAAALSSDRGAGAKLAPEDWNKAHTDSAQRLRTQMANV